MQVLWDAGKAGNLKVDIVTVVSLDKQLLAVAAPQAHRNFAGLMVDKCPKLTYDITISKSKTFIRHVILI